MIKGRYVATVTIDFNYPDDWIKGCSIGYSIDKWKKWLSTDADVKKKEKQPKSTVTVERSGGFRNEIDLRGMDSMEAVAATERFLDNAVMAKLEKVTIIHGKGTGALRAAVQQSLRKNKAVKSYRLGRYGEGESGVTVVELK